jgi:hypothetical protein
MAEINYQALQGCFPAHEIEWRIQQAGEKNGRIWAIAVPYVTNRAIQTRLDDVVGPANWRNQFRPGPDGGVMCGISVRVGDEWVTKWDGAENTDVEGVKGGLSAAMKRAAVQWGIGRYLYALEESFAHVHDTGRFRGKTRDGTAFRWDPPELPAWALPPRDGGGLATPQGFTEHDAMLEFIRSAGKLVPDEAEIRIQRRARNLKEFVRENWPVIKEQPRIARAVVFAVETATGTRFEFEHADPALAAA